MGTGPYLYQEFLTGVVWYMPIITASRRLKHGCEFEGSMDYLRRPYLMHDTMNA